jgi:hypothetical protein
MIVATTINIGRAPDGSNHTNNDFTWLLARRATSGATPELIKEMKAVGWQNWLNDQLAPGRIDDSAYDQAATRFNWMAEPIWAAAQFTQGNPLPSKPLLEQLKAEHTARLAWSRRQLQAVMVDFWANHFNV